MASKSPLTTARSGASLGAGSFSPAKPSSRRNAAPLPRFGLVMLERVAVALLCVWLNRTRLLGIGAPSKVDAKADGKAGSKAPLLLSDAEADELLLRPLQQLGQQLGAAANAEQHTRHKERLGGFARALGACMRAAHVPPSAEQRYATHAAVQTRLPAFAMALDALLAERHDVLVAISWPSTWAAQLTPGDGSAGGSAEAGTEYLWPVPYFEYLGAEGNERAAAYLGSAVSCMRGFHAHNTAEVWAQLQREPGWRGVPLSALKEAENVEHGSVVQEPLGEALKKPTRLVRPLSSGPRLEAALHGEALARSHLEAEDALSILEGLANGAAPRNLSAVKAQSKRLKRFAAKAEGRQRCLGLLTEKIVLPHALAEPLPEAIANPAKNSHSVKGLQHLTSDLLRGIERYDHAGTQLLELEAIFVAAACLRPAGYVFRASSSDAATAALTPPSSGHADLVVETAATTAAPGTLPPMPPAALPPLPPMPEMRLLAASAAPEVELVFSDDEEEEDAAEEGADEEGGVSYEALSALEAREVSRQQAALGEAQRRARRAIEASKARLIQRSWRRWRRAVAAEESGGGADDEVVAMYRERLERFRSTQAMKRQGHCLFCGCAWEGGHAKSANGHHWAQRERFKLYEALVHGTAAPLLARLDTERAQLQWEEVSRPEERAAGAVLDERAETARFEALHEIERSYGDLTKCMDDVEARQAWAALDGLKATVEFAQIALQRAEAVRTGAALNGDEGAAAASALGSSGEGARGEGAAEAVAGQDEEEEEAEEEEDDELLAQMVAAQARKQGRKPSWQRGSRGGGGGGGGKRANKR